MPPQPTFDRVVYRLRKNSLQGDAPCFPTKKVGNCYERNTIDQTAPDGNSERIHHATGKEHLLKPIVRPTASRWLHESGQGALGARLNPCHGGPAANEPCTARRSALG